MWRGSCWRRQERHRIFFCSSKSARSIKINKRPVAERHGGGGVRLYNDLLWRSTQGKQRNSGWAWRLGERLGWKSPRASHQFSSPTWRRRCNDFVGDNLKWTYWSCSSAWWCKNYFLRPIASSLSRLCFHGWKTKHCRIVAGLYFSTKMPRLTLHRQHKHSCHQKDSKVTIWWYGRPALPICILSKTYGGFWSRIFTRVGNITLRRKTFGKQLRHLQA
jgi:hypothetical protein